MIRTTNVRDGFVNTRGLRSVTEETYAKWTRRLIPRAGDLILTREAPLGEVGKIRGNEALFLGQRLYQFRIDVDLASPDFVMYSLLGSDLQGQIKSFGSGSTVEHMRLPDISLLELDVPERHLQRKIASILSAYDDLIDTNRRRIEILEETSRAIYREWFEEFRHPHVELAAPVWATGPISSFVDINPREPTPAGAVKYLPMDSLSTRDMTLGAFESRSRATGTKFRNSDTLMARITPSLENGKTGFVVGLSDGEVGCGSTEFIVLRGRALSPEFVYCLARSDTVRSVAIASMTGATGRQRVSTACFDDLNISAPPAELDELFVARVRDNFTLMQVLVLQNQNLAAQRDLLLPKLISGELDVSELTIDTSRIEEQDELWRESTSV